MLNASEPLEFLRFLHNLFQNSFSLQPAIAKDLFSFTLARLIELGRNMTVQRLSWILLSLTKMDLDLTWELDKICSLILQQSYYLAPKSILLTLKSFIIPKSGMNLALHKYCHKEAIKLIESSADYNEAFTAAYLCINHELPPHLRADKGTIKRFVKKLNELHKTDERIKIEDGILFQLLQYYPKETKKIKEHFYDPKSKEVMLYLSNFNKRVNKDFSNLRDMIDLAPKDALPYVKQAIIGNTLSRLRKGIQDEELEKYATFYIHNDIDSKTLDLLVNAIIKDRTKVRSIMIILEELIECHRGFSNYKQVLGDVLEAALNPKKINLYHSLSLWFTVNGHKKFQPIADDIWQNIAAKKVSLMDFAEIFNKVNVNKGLLKNKRIFYEKLHPILDFAEEKPFYSISIINAIYYDMLKSKVPLTTITSFYEAACKNIRSPEGIPTAEIVFKGRTLLAQTLYFPSPLKKLFLDHFNLHAVKDPELLRFLCLAAFPEVYEESFSFIPEKLKDYSIVSSAHYAGKDKVKYEKLKEYRDKLVDNLYKLVNTNKLSETMDLLQPLFLDCLEPDPKVSKLIEVLVAHLQVIKQFIEKKEGIEKYFDSAKVVSGHTLLINNPYRKQFMQQCTTRVQVSDLVNYLSVLAANYEKSFDAEIGLIVKVIDGQEKVQEIMVKRSKAALEPEWKRLILVVQELLLRTPEVLLLSLLALQNDICNELRKLLLFGNLCITDKPTEEQKGHLQNTFIELAKQGKVELDELFACLALELHKSSECISLLIPLLTQTFEKMQANSGKAEIILAELVEATNLKEVENSAYKALERVGKNRDRIEVKDIKKKYIENIQVQLDINNALINLQCGLTKLLINKAVFFIIYYQGRDKNGNIPSLFTLL
eukprot:TRINITY_DN1289_c0_g1_i2.p1 TRINITY_DN1289_c0_g1~~TRINITY_DN1289_c0_g1_i2.p1  ORF type:complete len:882 (-),score=70.97 TRINITY_DN1289_c0_g1_i2:4741-7386(-)